MKLRAKRLSENKMALFNIMSTALVAGINFFTIPIFTRVLDTSGYGIVSVYTAWVQICTILIGLKADGSISTASANIAEEEQDSYQLSILVMSTISFAAMFAMSQLFMDDLARLLGMEPRLVTCMVLQGFGAYLVSFFNARYIFRKQAQFNFAISVGLCVATTALSMALIFFVFPEGEGYMGRVLGLTLPNLLLGVTLYLSSALRWRRPVRTDYWRFCLALTIPLIFHGLSQLVLAQSDRVIIQRLHGDSLAGIYSIAATVVSLLNTIYLALNNAFVPFMFDDLAGKTSEEVKQSHFSNYFHLFTFGTCAFSLMCPEVLKIMSTEAYWSALEVLPMLVIGQYCVYLYSFPVNYEFFKMRTASIAVGTALAAILNTVLNILLIPRFGMHGAAFATMVAYFFLFVFHFYIARNRLGDRNYPVTTTVTGLVMVTIASLSYYLIQDFVLVRWIIGIVMLLIAVSRILRTRSIF